ncbi:hypothetical protein EC968_002255 [Mortierella alpina]|nr:hypothetical protein EC968_002255 [Mortierella alpina]
MSHSNTNGTSDRLARSAAPAPRRTKKCELFYRDSAIPERMDLHVKSYAPQELVFSLPRRDASRDRILTQILDTFTYVDSFHYRIFPNKVQYRITVDDSAHYDFIREHPGLTINGRTYAPSIPVPWSMKLRRVNFRSALNFLTAEQFIRVFEPYGKVEDKVDEYGNSYRKTVAIPEILHVAEDIEIHTKTVTDTTSNISINLKIPSNSNVPSNINIHSTIASPATSTSPVTVITITAPTLAQIVTT